ncbi:MAG: EamA/RhaT family transporter [Candidatus Aenigmarchaeota archaeon]|nr:EamA/RhaT family transporter [Candidatus Aenigmarchaeota archaeon]
MKSNLKGIGLIIICTFLTTIAQMAFKLGSSSLEFSLLSLVNSYIIIGFLAYGLTAILFIVALKFGELSLLYPVWSLSFVWVTISSIVLLGESLSLVNWMGIALIIVGVSFIGFGARND